MFTDGISEAMNPDNKLYGLDRLAAAVGRQAPDVSRPRPASSSTTSNIRRRPLAERRHVPGLLRAGVVYSSRSVVMDGVPLAKHT